MEVVLEFHEVEAALRLGLAAQGIQVPPEAILRVRKNNKLGTIRAVFVTPKNQPPPNPDPHT